MASRSFVALSPLLRRSGSDDHLARVPTFLRFAFRFTLFALHSIVVGPLVVGGYPHNAAYVTEKRGEGGSILVMKLKKRERERKGGKEEGNKEERSRRVAEEGRKREKKREEKRTRRASCIHYGALTATKVRVADTRGTRDREPAVLLAREKENGGKSGQAEPSRYVFA